MNLQGTHQDRLVVAVAGGKGGVGKSLVSAGMAVGFAELLQERGESVIAVDLDFGCGNLNSCLGVKMPQGSINDWLFGRTSSLQDLLNDGPLPNLKLIASSYQGTEMVELPGWECERLIDALGKLQAKVIVLDLAAGISSTVLDLFCWADEKIVVTTPESIALHNAYLFLKNTILRTITRQLNREEFLEPIAERFDRIVRKNPALSMKEVLEQLKEWDRYSSFIVSGLMEELKFRLLLNMRREDREESYLRNFSELVRKYLYIRGNIQYLGALEFDQRVRPSLQKLKPFVLEHPQSQVSQSLRHIARDLLAMTGRSLP